jgi:NitT/TauT family transport system substrate-binding protein
MRLGSRLRAAAPWVLAAILALLAGCGGGDNEGAGGTSTGGGAKTTAVTVQDVAGIPSEFLTAGVKKGFFSRHGLDVTVKIAAGGAAIIPAVVSGETQFGGSNVVSVLIAASKGLPIQMVASGTFGPRTEDDDWSAILVRGQSAVRTPKDLEGKTIAVNTLNNVATETANAALKNLGADPSKVKYTEVDFPDMLAALQKGRVDAAFEIEPFVTAGLAQGARRVVSPYYATKPDLQIGSYVATKEYVQEHPDVVKAFRDGLDDTAAFVRENPGEFRKLLASQGVKGAQKLQLPTWKAAIDRGSLETHASLMRQQGLIEKPPPLNEVVAGGAAG